MRRMSSLVPPNMPVWLVSKLFGHIGGPINKSLRGMPISQPLTNYNVLNEHVIVTNSD